MKKSAITDIFRKSKGCMETMQLPKEYFTASKKTYEIFDELKEKLSPELSALLEKFDNALLDHRSDEIDFFFAEGFKLGLLLGIECAE